MRAKITSLEYVENDVYIDNHKRKFLADRKRKIGYLLDDVNPRTLFIFKNRITVSILVGIFVGAIFGWTAAIVVTLLAIAIMEYVYRAVFLPRFEVYENMNFPEVGIIERYRAKSSSTNVLKSVIGIAIIILAIINVVTTLDLSNITSDTNTMLTVLFSVLGCSYVLMVCILSLLAVVTKK